MRLLLDTHVWLWWLRADARLSAEHYALVNAGANPVFVSATSVWEAAIKQAAGKLQAPENLGAAVTSQGFTALPITTEHAAAAGGLPLHHKDPFDRMLVAQAQVEGLTLMTHDPAIGLYPVRRISV